MEPTVAIRYYNTSLCRLYALFLTMNPEMRPGYTSWRSLKPGYVRKLTMDARCVRGGA
jgi:hypothetical protein